MSIRLYKKYVMFIIYMLAVKVHNVTIFILLSMNLSVDESNWNHISQI